MMVYFTTAQRQLVIECAATHIARFVARKASTGWEHQQEQDQLRASFRASWKAALAHMRRDGAKSRRRP